MMRLSSVLMVLAGLVDLASAGDGSSPAAKVRVGVNQTTLEYVRSTIDHHTGHAARATYKTLTDANLYHRFLAGQLDVVSVFGRPDQLGIDGFADGFHKPPTELVVGHVACMVVVPGDRKIARLTLAQLADVVAGKITGWDQLGAGAGRIEVRADPVAFERKATDRAAEKGQKALLPADASQFASLTDSIRQCATPAVQLDPTNEAAAYALTGTEEWWQAPSSFPLFLQRAIACEVLAFKKDRAGLQGGRDEYP